MEKTTVFVVRHGQTEWNLEHRIQGQLDSALTESGKAQAVALARRFAGESVDVLYCSDLGRALQTAEIIAQATGLSVQSDPRLRERHHGIFQGCTAAESRTRFPQEYARYLQGAAGYAMPQGESKHQLQRRVSRCLRDIGERHPGQRVVLITHGGVVNAVLKCVLGIPVARDCRIRLFNAALNVIVRENGGWVVETIGDVAHLSSLSAFNDAFQ